jgi:hypothetical protein
MAGIRGLGARIPFVCLVYVAGFSGFTAQARAADAPTFPNSITIGDFSVDYPDGWSTQTAGGVTSLYAVSAS